MAKNKQPDLNLTLNEAPAPAPAAKAPAKGVKANKTGKSKVASDRPNIWLRIAKKCRELVSELKKVEWPPFRSTKKTTGVWQNTGTVVVVVLVFMVLITAFDSGLSALFKLLVGINK